MSAPTDRRVNPKLLYALGTVAVAALAFVFVVNPLMLSDDGDDVVAIPAPAHREPAAEPPDDSVEDDDVPEALEVFSARDPFQQLVVTADGGPGEGSTPVPVDPPAPVGEVTVRLSKVVLDDGGIPRALLTVNGTDHKPAVGDTVADRVRLLAIADQCATVAIDQERVALCAGEDVRR